MAPSFESWNDYPPGSTGPGAVASRSSDEGPLLLVHLESDVGTDNRFCSQIAEQVRDRDARRSRVSSEAEGSSWVATPLHERQRRGLPAAWPLGLKPALNSNPPLGQLGKWTRGYGWIDTRL